MPEIREPPHNFQAEQAILGGLLIANRAYDAVAEFLRPEHFADPLHGRIFEAMATLIQADKVASPVSLKPSLSNEVIPAPHTIASYLVAMAAAAVSARDVPDYAKQVHDLWMRREAIDAANSVIAAAYEGGTGAAVDIIEQAEGRLSGIIQGQGVADTVSTGATALDEAVAQIEEAMRDSALPEAERRRNAVVTGLEALDSMFRMRPGNLVIVAGAPSMGKSALADNIAEANERRGIPVALFILEMGRDEWMQRRLARHTGISENRMDGGAISQHEYERIADARKRLSARPCFLDHTANLTPAGLRSKLRRLKRKHGIKLAVVDYLQLMAPDKGRRAGNRTEEVGALSRALKVMAAELELTIIAVSQINRGVDGRDDKRPQLADLRESGSIEQDANSVLFVYREEYYLSRTKAMGKGGKPPSVAEEEERETRLAQVAGTAEIIVAKQRRGEAGVNKVVKWDGLRTLFADMPNAEYGEIPE